MPCERDSCLGGVTWPCGVQENTMTEEKKAKGSRPRKKNGELFPSSTGGPGKRVVDQTNWRRQLQERRIKFDDKAKWAFIAEFAMHNRFMHACEAAGVSFRTVKAHIENDPEFAELVEEAKEFYKSRVLKHAQRLMLEGMSEPILGGKFKDEVVGEKIIYPIQLIAMEMKKVDPDYKDRQEIEHKGGGGVLVAPAGKSPEEWVREAEEHNAKAKKPGEEVK